MRGISTIEHRYMRIVISASILVGIFVWSGFALGAMSSTNWEIQWDTVGNGGSDDSTSTSYELRDTIGNSGPGNATSASYDLRAGYRQGVFDQILTFDVFPALRSSRRTVSASAGTTITTSTAGLAIGDYVALVQNEGASQVSAIGRIVSIGVGAITVDSLKDAGAAPVIDGTNDVLYQLTGSAIDLDELDPAQVNTAILGFEVTADLPNGYVVQIAEDGDLRDGAFNINDVADGAVTVGSEEYGAISSDSSVPSSLFDTQDSAFTTTLQDVADETSLSSLSRNFLTLKASINGSTEDGTYGQVLTLIVSGNF